MTINILLLPILIPFIAGLFIFILPKNLRGVKEFVTLLITLANLLLTIFLFNKNIVFSLPWLGTGFDFSLRLYHFSAFIILAVAGFAFLVSLYSSVFMLGREGLKQFYAYLLITVAFVNGAVLADNLIILLFFWEGLLLTLFGMIAIGGKASFKTATKAFIIMGVCDLCMMFGIILTGVIAGTLTMSKINLPLNTLGSIAFIFLMIGAISKAGSMPFHSWIPDAANDAPLPFMAFLPASLEKLLGIYLLARISLDLFQLNASSWVSTLLMTIGAITILLAVMMALIQKDYKRLLSYHAISQVGYMILGIGTAVPAGIIGGLFHMINHAMYKSGLFLTGGSVEKQAGTTILDKLGGLGKKMPLTFICFLITAASISGVPPFNGFFSKELIYDGALERGWIFYIAAALGSFLTAASFLKLGHSAYLGKLNENNKNVKEAPLRMLVPMIVIASFCIFFGVCNWFPINKLIAPILGVERLEGHSFAGMPTNIMIVVVTFVVLIAAFLNHIFGVKAGGSALKAADHIHYAPVLSIFYNRAEKRFFDPYDIGLKITGSFSKVAFWIDRLFDALVDNLTVFVSNTLSKEIRRQHNGNYSVYLVWSMVGMFLVIIFLMYSG
ncbi:MAG: proton-conducting transporter membrane subunit [Candidatus Omnitrophica bacterium]|nr:proton-conducting transporter membrane subunit [Candidatus Omnitrophota bacterium]